ncbi:MAG: hypothetical protein ACE5G2_09955 [Candidatus Krumholzibacteriia bacterium]
MRTREHRLILSGLLLLVAALPAWGAVGPDVTAADAAFRFVVLSDVHMTTMDLPGSRAQPRAARRRAARRRVNHQAHG